MKKLYFLNEEEKNRILSLHESAAKRQYLSEENQFLFPQMENPYQTALDKMKSDGKAKLNSQERQTNINKVYCGLNNGVITGGTWKDRKWDEYVKTYKISSNEIQAAKKSCPKTNQTKQNSGNRQQIISQTENNTKAIQKLLKLPETGIMDTTLLQKINEALNGGGQQSQPRPQVEPIQQLTPAGVKTQQLTTMSPEQLTAGLQQMQQKAAAATAGLKR